MNLENCIEVGSVSEFLDAVKQIYCDQDHQLFYRGVSKKVYFKSPLLEYKPKPQYIAQQYACLIIGNETIKKSFYSLEKAKSLLSEQSNDHPGIYRNKSWIDNEDKMFYELTAKCPEYFKDCKTTFEYLVMMQHYGYPTRLLDITSNPLVALYFACGGLNGSNSEDGQLISYHIKKNDIRNYESDCVNLLSNLSLAHQELNYIIFIFCQLEMILKSSFKIPNLYYPKRVSQVIQDFNYVMHVIDTIVISYPSLNEDMIIFANSLNNDENTRYDIERKFGNISVHSLQFTNDYNELLNDREQFLGMFFPKNQFSLEEKKIVVDKKLRLIKSILDIVEINLRIMRHNYDSFIHRIKNEKPFFNSSAINSLDLRTIQCVLPKQNNPRLIAQQGAFLLFGFKDAVSDKTATPVVDPKMYGELCMKDENSQPITTQSSGNKAEIIIKGSEKQKILDELKILGISNSTMFPEIDNIANELKNQYAKPR